MATLTEKLGNIAPRNSAVLRAATRAEKMPEYLAKQLEVIIFVQGRDIFTVLPTSCGNNMLWFSCSREIFSARLGAMAEACTYQWSRQCANFRFFSYSYAIAKKPIYGEEGLTVCRGIVRQGLSW